MNTSCTKVKQVSHPTDQGTERATNIVQLPGTLRAEASGIGDIAEAQSALQHLLERDGCCVYDTTILAQLCRVAAAALDVAIDHALDHKRLRLFYIGHEAHWGLPRANDREDMLSDFVETPLEIIFETQVPPQHSSHTHHTDPAAPSPTSKLVLDPVVEQRRFELTVQIDSLHEKVLLMRVVVVLEVITILMMLRQLWLDGVGL